MATRIELAESIFVALKGAMEKLGDRTVYSVDISAEPASDHSETMEGTFRTVYVVFTVGYGTFDDPCKITYRCDVGSLSGHWGWTLSRVEKV